MNSNYSKEKNTDKIDFVITWVDGNDQTWLKSKRQYESAYLSDDCEKSNARYRDWNNLKYWFRGVEKYAPWVNRVFFVTAGHIPQWLATDYDKLKIIRHDEFIPQEYLPTFSSHPIELNLFRITELSEQFVYFNDDMFLVSETKPETFFEYGLPCDEAVLNVHCPQESIIIHTIAANDAGVINEHFNMKEIVNNNIRKWFHYSYGLNNLLQNGILFSCPRFPGFKQYHCPQPLLRSTCNAVWSADKSLHATSLNKFRQKTDVNQWVFREWAIATGQFFPSPIHKRTRLVAFDSMEYSSAIAEIKKALHDNMVKMLCINDFDHDGDKFDIIQAMNDVGALLEEKFPEKSAFER